MQITFYTTSSAPNVLTKELSQIGLAEALAPTGQVTVLNPVLVIDYDSTLLAANYAYIDTFKRYYWINLALDTAGRLIVSCKVDYLMSWADSIKNCPAMILRNENISPNFVPDDKLPIDPNRFFIRGTEFPLNPIEYDTEGNKPYLLILNGGAP